ncbi:hypothetical protein N790_02630 [Arenimonas malthae CC-JY-1]|uniref:Uncharacterized protein n=1 Tax=Arenimonas malthae CC-JY-1 TaxID=1384054 RepID=A0A091AVJ1_9GAMM|nr:polysaccharide biosynthesis C-terminal domain-containing protein [Arenimonas malthae]KFN43282.1 hypothetical protein N790_02630 [Arenimonas malthae CC-JY-1]
MAWNIARLAAQLAWVILMARTLGVEGYGTFSGVAGLALAISGLAGAGLGLRLYQDVARTPGLLGIRWAQAVRALAWSGALLWLGFILFGSMVYPGLSVGVLACVGAAELIGTPMVVHVAFAYAAHGRMAQAAAAPVALSCGRVLAVLVLPLFASEGDMQTYALLHVITTMVGAGLIWRRCRRQLSPPATAATLDRGALGEGARLSAIWASGLALGAVDKAVALREGGAGLAGQYTAANRFASLLTLPVDALVTAVMPRLFRAGAGHSTHPGLVGWLLAAALLYGLVAGGLLWSGAGLLPGIVGAEFGPAVPALQVLALYVPAYCLRILGANILLGYGWIRWRLASELLVLATTVLLMAWLIPRRGAEGAAWALVMAEGLLALLLWVRVLVGWPRAKA